MDLGPIPAGWRYDRAERTLRCEREDVRIRVCDGSAQMGLAPGFTLRWPGGVIGYSRYDGAHAEAGLPPPAPERLRRDGLRVFVLRRLGCALSEFAPPPYPTARPSLRLTLRAPARDLPDPQERAWVIACIRAAMRAMPVEAAAGDVGAAPGETGYLVLLPEELDESAPPA